MSAGICCDEPAEPGRRAGAGVEEVGKSGRAAGGRLDRKSSDLRLSSGRFRSPARRDNTASSERRCRGGGCSVARPWKDLGSRRLQRRVYLTFGPWRATEPARAWLCVECLREKRACASTQAELGSWSWWEAVIACMQEERNLPANGSRRAAPFTECPREG